MPPRLKPLLSVRRYATASSGPHTPGFQVFNRHTKLLQRERAARSPLSRTTDYLRNHVANDLVERLLLINRKYPRVLDLGAGPGYIAKALLTPRQGVEEGTTERVSDRIETLVAGELSPTLLHRDDAEPWNKEIANERVVLDEEALPFEDNSFDAVVSSGSMHWINDLPQALREVNRVLKPDAPLVAAMFGGDTLYELRTSLQLAEQERHGGVSPRVSPLADTRDVGGLLDKAGFSLLTIDVDDVVIDFPDSFALMMDLQAMGEGNAVLGRKQGQISRDVLMAAEGIYRQLHGNTDDTLPATFRVIYMIGWKKAENQPKPLERGSAQFSLKDVLEGDKKK
ncbi:S-adenosyl-L-methionine-dependent methyltransferase [Wilcoxina mikolae CBS 423.85]|nr:S-adenosyl-L-methionine-dependent methyltransferase [Wilcoxina mikolae CBS 423.85]